MKIARISLLIPMLLLGSIVAPNFVFLAHVGPEKGCLADPSLGPTSSSCPSSPPVVNALPQSSSGGIVCIASVQASICPVSPPVLSGPAPGPGSQFEVAVIVNSSQALSGFDITLVTNSSLLLPSSVQIGSLLANTHDIVKCIGGVNKLGSSACPATDTASTIEYGSVGDITYEPNTGVLFFAIYNVTSQSPTSPIGFQTGCANTSVSGGVCVTIANGTPFPVPETYQTAKFSNLAYFVMAPNVGTLQISQGDTDYSEFVDVMSVNGFGGTTGATVNLSTSVSSAALSPLPLFTVSPSSVMVAIGSDGLAGLAISVPKDTPPGSYMLNLTGTSPGLPTNSVTIQLIVPQPNISIVSNPARLFFNATFSGTSLVTVTSIGNFQGNVTLSLAYPVQINASFSDQKSTQTLELTSKGSNATTLTVSSTVAGGYFLNITAMSGSLVHTSTLTVAVLDFRMEAANGGLFGSLIVVNGTPATEPVTIFATDAYFSATVTIGQVSVYQIQTNRTLPSNGIAVGCDPTELSIISYHTAYRYSVGSNSTYCLVTAHTVGNYTVTVAATSGSGIHTSSHSVSFPVAVVTVLPPPPPSFNISASSTDVVVSAGTNATSTIVFSSMNGFAGTITLSAYVYAKTSAQTYPIVILHPTSVVLSSGGNATSILLVATTRNTSVAPYSVEISGYSSSSLPRGASLNIDVQPTVDAPPVARFTVSPSNPIVGEQVGFDGSSSYDPDGTVVSWTWSPGDGFGTASSNSPFFYHAYSLPGNYTVTLTVQDNAGLTGTKSILIFVRSQPAHDVSIISINPYPIIAVATQQIRISIQVRNDGFSNETVSIAAYANGRVIQTRNNIFLQGCRINQFQNFCYYYSYEDIIWDTTNYAPGNYTISASISLPAGEVDPTLADNSLTYGTVIVLPPPVLTVTPNSGGVGTKVTVSGSGFAAPTPGYVYSEPVSVTFDDMFLGQDYNAQNGTFSFVLDVPQAQPGTHLVKAVNLYSGARAFATFTVTVTNTVNLAVTVNTGSVYFPGDKVVAYILTTLNGVPTGPSNLQVTVTLFFSNGTSRSMTTASLGSGLYEAVYSVPKTGPLGTYAIIAKVHMPGPLDASSMATFEVKLSWLSSNAGNIAGIATVAGIVGLVGVAWKKGYLRRRDETGQFFD